MGLGLWLSGSAAQQLLVGGRLKGSRDWLADLGLVPWTMNGFPHGDFHQRVVKHQVYHPTWFHKDRFVYTLDLINIQNELLPEGMEGSISTLPIAWGDPAVSGEDLSAAALDLHRVADYLACLEKDTGRFIYLCLEPEPGCVLQRSHDLVRFFKLYLHGRSDDRQIRRYLRVCHDICHQAIMFEDQAEVFRAYRDAGISVGKVQVSSAVSMPLPRLPASQRDAAVKQLAEFVEERYLHQTVVSTGSTAPAFFEDLPLALARARNCPASGACISTYRSTWNASASWRRHSSPSAKLSPPPVS